MPLYHIQHKIRVLLHNNTNISPTTKDNAHSFVVDGITFKPWGNDPREYYRANEWLVISDIEAVNLAESIKDYSAKMSKIIPRIAFVGQAYINDKMGPIFIKRDDRDFGWLRSIIISEPVPLNFMDKEKEALDSLLSNQLIPDAFYYYWNDAVNTTSYTGKLLLMFGAIDSLAIKGQRRAKRIEILGNELSEEIYANDKGFRNRLTHGEYLEGSSNKNYVEEVHKKVLIYFNSQIIKKDILTLSVVDPQRHFDENYVGGKFYVKQSNDNFPLDIYSLVDDITKNEGIPRSYEIMFNKDEFKGY